LYVGYEADFYALTPAFALVVSSPTGQLYELLESSLPKKVYHAINREQAATSYLVALPAQTRNAIDKLSQRYVEIGGSIVIGGDGNVSYEG